MAVQLIVDSACDLTAEQAKQLGVILIPMPITFGNDQYLSGVDLSPAQFYELLAEAKELPTTSQPAPYDYAQAFRQVQEQGDEAVVLCISSALSGTYQSVRIIAEEFGGAIHVVDTLSVTIGERMLLDYAIQLREQGMGAAELAQELEQAKSRLYVCGVVETLDYLVKGGRLSKAAGAAGTLLGIRPILEVREGALQVVAKARGPKAACATINRLLNTYPRDVNMPFMTGHTGVSDADLQTFLAAADSIWDKAPRAIVGSTVGTHTGPHLLCFGFFRK